ncbi:MAG: DUF2027 domain-containing protein [Bacteroidota bacterium]
MNIGDRVRLMRGKEEGIITKILANNIIEMEIEDGFTIPVKASEVVIISELEQKVFNPTPASRIQIQPQSQVIDKRQAINEILSNRGIYMAFIPVNDRELSQHLINNTDWDLPFTLTVGSDPHHKGLAAGVLKPKSFIKVQSVFVKDFEDWGTFVFQAFFFRLAFMKQPDPILKRLKFRVNSFFKNKSKAPLLNQDAHLFQLDAEDSVTPVNLKIDPEKIIEKMFEKQAPEPIALPTKPSLSVDLHIEELTKDSWAMDNGEMLTLQMGTFERQFEAAIANGMDEITFIHGVGNYVLRDAIHRRLSGNKNVQFFEDAQKEKFGYGATRVKIK